MIYKARTFYFPSANNGCHCVNNGATGFINPKTRIYENIFFKTLNSGAQINNLKIPGKKSAVKSDW